MQLPGGNELEGALQLCSPLPGLGSEHLQARPFLLCGDLLDLGLGVPRDQEPETSDQQKWEFCVAARASV